MEIYKLGDLGAIVTGTTPPKQNPEYFSFSGIPFLTPSDIAFGRRRNFTERFLSPSGVEWAKKRILPPGASSVVCIGSTIGKVSQIDRPTLTNQQLNSVVPDSTKCDANFLYYSLTYIASDLKRIAGGSTAPILNKSEFAQLEIKLPKLMEQRRIAGILGALDDKIESNLRARNLCRDLGGNLVADTVRSAPSTQLEHYAASISRGVTPQYYKDEDVSPVLVLNQKCIRDGWVTPELARLMTPRAREKSQAIARLDDLLVNSTGQGTLGRVARWDSDDPIYVDSHVTVVKADPRRIYPVLMPYLVFPLQDEIEHMATGSTGQTELSPSRLAQLNVPLLTLEEQRPLSARLVALEAQAHYCQVQSLKLTELRDALLPELMSGRMRVDEAGCLVSETLDEEIADV